MHDMFLQRKKYHIDRMECKKIEKVSIETHDLAYYDGDDH